MLAPPSGGLSRGDFCNCQHAAIAPHHVKIRPILFAPDALVTLNVPCDKNNRDNSIKWASMPFSSALQRGTLVVGVGVLWVLWSTILAHLMLLARFLLHMARLGSREHQKQLGWAESCPGVAR